MSNCTVFSGIKVTVFGHASVLLEADGLRIYTDPFVLPKGAAPADAILYTHGHSDHCAAAPSITTNQTILIGHGCKLPARVIDIGGKERIGNTSVEAVHAYNNTKPFHQKGEGAGFIVQFRTGRVYIAGDTDFIPEMKGYRCDIAIVPIGGRYTMDVEEAADAIVAISPKIAIPYHYNYLDQTRADAGEFRRLVEERSGGKVGVRLLIL